MKFSYKLLKKLNPSAPAIKKTAELLTMHLFETEAAGKRVLEVGVLPNRYSDAASHIGLARETAAITGKAFKIPAARKIKREVRKGFDVEVSSNLCRRMSAAYFQGIKIASSPKWMQEILLDCGMRPINNLVDITNYVTLETGQPLHAFDADKMSGRTLFVRKAKKGEGVESLDGKKYELGPDNLVLADGERALDVAGIKGGIKAGITSQTKNILLTAGNFDGSNIYRTSRKINLITDASIRFSHDISPELVEAGINRAAELIKELCGGKVGELKDVYLKKQPVKLFKFDVKKFNKISGLALKEAEALDYLKRLDFKMRSGKKIEAPLLRTDIEFFEDVAEEITRLYGYERLLPAAPAIALKQSGYENQIVLKDDIRNILKGFGLDEVYNYTFLSEGKIKLENPTSKLFAYLRPSLLPHLRGNIEDNFRFFDKIAVFEIGKAFSPKEKLMLGIAVADKRQRVFAELKGIVESLLGGVGLVDCFVKESSGGVISIESDHSVIGNLFYENGGKTTLAEIDLEKTLALVEGEKSFTPLPKYPSIMRDLSILVSQSARVSEIISLIEIASSNRLKDVDLIDFYEDPKFKEGFRSLTFRLVFLAEDKTLTDKEADEEMKKVIAALTENLDVEIR